MKKWNKTTIEECTDVLGDGLHGTPKYTPGGEYAFINGNNLIDGKVIIKKDTKRISEEEYEKYKKPLNERTLFVSINGTLGNVGKYGGEQIILGKSACYFNVKECVDKEFLFYVVCAPSFKQYLETNATGTTIKNVSLKQMREYEFYIPDLQTQRKISSLLGVIDERIRINKEINDNLLQQARVIFQQWLASASSATYKLSDIADINPETYSPKDNWSFVNYLDTSSITAGAITEIQYILPSEEKLPSRARRILRKGDVVFSTVRPNQLHYGIISNPKTNMLGSTGFAVIRSKLMEIPNEIIYLALTEPVFVEQMQQLAEQSVSTFPSIRPADLDACVLPKPMEGDNDFIETIKDIFNMVAANYEVNQRLVVLRDTLLPRLMSGELDVSGLDI